MDYEYRVCLYTEESFGNADTPEISMFIETDIDSDKNLYVVEGRTVITQLNSLALYFKKFTKEVIYICFEIRINGEFQEFDSKAYTGEESVDDIFFKFQDSITNIYYN